MLQFNSFAVRRIRKDTLTPTPLIICHDCYQQPREVDKGHVNFPRCEGCENGRSNASNVSALHKVGKQRNDIEIESLPGITANCILTKEQLWGKLSAEESYDIPAAFNTNFVVEDNENEYEKSYCKRYR